ncbi:MAG: hypothetical protein J6U54_22735 [Clostridiales bacterium]|nr:hypothetical protein [Clostridiales bacterium]
MPNPVISSLTIPVLENGTVRDKTYDLSGGGGGGSGSGDMQSSVYDPDGDVATAGGIVQYIDDTITAALTASY